MKNSVSAMATEDRLSEAELASYRRALQEERSRIARSLAESSGVLTAHASGGDEADLAASIIDFGVAATLIEQRRMLLRDIEHALGKLRDGSFGYCEATGEPITKRRLEHRPWSRHSIAFEEKLEKMRRAGVAPRMASDDDDDD